MTPPRIVKVNGVERLAQPMNLETSYEPGELWYTSEGVFQGDISSNSKYGPNTPRHEHLVVDDCVWITLFSTPFTKQPFSKQTKRTVTAFTVRTWSKGHETWWLAKCAEHGLKNATGKRLALWTRCTGSSRATN